MQLSLAKEIVRGLQKPRSGWIMRDIPCEIAETILHHTKKVVHAARIYGKHFPDIDYEKLVKMARYHDFAEYRETDYVPGQISEEEKHQREKRVIEYLRDHFGRGQEVFDVWMEFEAGETVEARIVKQLDKLDPAVQAMEYERIGYSQVTEFYPYARTKVDDPTLLHILDVLLVSKEQNIYPEFPFYEQYFILLETRGDEVEFRRICQSKLELSRNGL